MCTFIAEDMYNLDRSLMPQVEQNPMFGPPKGHPDEHSGYDNLFDMESSFMHGFETVNYDRILSPPMDLQQALGLAGNSDMDPWRIKKLSHNANERQRRKRLNSLYAQLGALLPNPNPRRKLSIPNTVCRVLKYVPELRNEIEKLQRQRDRLLFVKRNCESSVVTPKSKPSRQHSHDGHTCSPAIVAVNGASANSSEILVTIYTCKAALFLSSVLVLIEEEGFDVLDASSFVSRNRVCRILHLQTIRRSELDTEDLQEKIRLLCETSLAIES